MNIAAILAAASFLIEKGAPLFRSLGASEEVVAGIGLTAKVAPTAIELLEDLKSGKADAATVVARWDEARKVYAEGRAAWDEAAEQP